MELKKIAENLIKFRTETGNLSEINRCFEYVQGLFGNEICRTLYQTPLF